MMLPVYIIDTDMIFTFILLQPRHAYVSSPVLVQVDCKLSCRTHMAQLLASNSVPGIPVIK